MIKIKYEDVMRAGSVSAAIIEYCKNSGYWSSGPQGPEFSTSGPGPGFSRKHDSEDFADWALMQGAGGYIDAEDGRFTEGRVEGWSLHSAVDLEAPTLEQVAKNPILCSIIYRSVLPLHSHFSSIKGWKSAWTIHKKSSR